MSAMLKRQRLGLRPDQTTDRISSLPDAILLHILSFLPIKDAAKSSLLSKRWDHLWTHLANLTFQYRHGSCLSRFANFVNHALILHQGAKVRRFCVSSGYTDDSRSVIDAWIHFAVRRNVEELHLELSITGVPNHWPFSLPRYLFRNQCIKELKLKRFGFHSLKSVNWPSLMRLSLAEIDSLKDERMNAILAGSPLLEELAIFNCSDLEFLNLTGKKVKSLSLGTDWRMRSLKLNAPNVRSFSLSGDYCSGYSDAGFVIDGMPCLERLELGVELEPLMDFLQHHREKEGQASEKLRKIFEDLGHAKHLSVSYECLQLFTILEMLKVVPQNSKRKSLTIETSLRKWELPGISLLMRNSAELDTLVIKIRPSDSYLHTEFRNKYRFTKGDYWESQLACFRSLSSDLKAIKLYSIVGWSNDIDPSGRYKEIWQEGWLRKKFDKEMELMKFLLRNTFLLEEIIICVNRNQDFQDAEKKDMLFSMFESLYSCPRASPHVKVSFF